MSNFNKLLILSIVTALLMPCLAKSDSDDFYAYYTRLDYTIPVEKADYIPQDPDEQSQRIIEKLEEMYEEEEEEEEEWDEEEEEDMEVEAEVPSLAGKTYTIEYEGEDYKWEFKEDGEARVSGGETGAGMRAEYEQEGTEVFLYVADWEGEASYDGETVTMIDEEDEYEEDENEEEEEEERRWERRFRNKPITGKYADVIVNVSDGSQLVFSRETSYRPYWKTEKGRWLVEELVPRQDDFACLYSYARIIKQQPDEIIVHYRYIPNLKNIDGFNDPVQEIFIIKPDGSVTRRIKRGEKKLDDFNDPANVTVQRLKLKPAGIEEIDLKEAHLSKSPVPAAKGNPVKAQMKQKPARWWKFDEGLKERPYTRKDITIESLTGEDCAITGNTTLWKKGISGTALAFDGYESGISLPTQKAPDIEDEMTAEAWVVLGAYPWNWAPLVHQSVVEPGPIEKGTYDERGKAEARKTGKGYYLGIGPYGHAFFTVDGQTVKSSKKLKLYRWTHVVGTYGNGSIRIYVDGKNYGFSTASGEIDIPDEDVMIGLNNRKGRPTDPVRGPLNQLPLIYGIEGLIDEVKIYDKVLTDSQIEDSFDYLEPDTETKTDPDLQHRILPGETGTAKNFGAYYTKLKYHELWDNLWRTSDYPDAVVKFDNMPTSVVYWRGANCAAGWVTENNKWMEDQSCETGGIHGCSEHMADKQCRHSYIRIIENTDARVVLHWRYPACDIAYLFPSKRHWSDEYHTIYPDGAGVRKVYFYRGSPGWQDVQFLTQPESTCADTMNWQAQTLANLDGEVCKNTWQGSNGVPRSKLEDACIERINFKSDYKVFLIFPEGTGIGTWGSYEQSPHTDDPFAGPWNHWPISQIPSDGRYAVAHDRITHAAIGASNVSEMGNRAIYGFTKEAVTELVPLARMWNNPPDVENAGGCASHGYDKNQRAYIFKSEDSKISFTLDATERSPVVNPCFVIKQWNSGSKATLNINSSKVNSGDKLRQGIVRDTDGTRKLVVWVEYRSESPVNFDIVKR